MDIALRIFSTASEVLAAIGDAIATSERTMSASVLLPGNQRRALSRETVAELSDHPWVTAEFTVQGSEAGAPNCHFSVQWARPDARAIYMTTLGARSNVKEVLSSAKAMKRSLSAGARAGVVGASAADYSKRKLIRDIWRTNSAEVAFAQGVAWRQFGSTTHYFPPDFSFAV